MKSLLVKILLASILSALPPLPPNVTIFNGIIRDTTGAPVQTGNVSFTLKPGVDTTTSGNARFTPNTVSCDIETPLIATYSGNGTTTTVTVTSAQPWQIGDSVIIAGTGTALDTTVVATFTLASAALGGTQFTFLSTFNGSGTGGYIGGMFSPSGTGPCTVIQNSAINPAYTSYSVLIQPTGVTTSGFNTYAIGSGPIDLSTVVPTPSQQPTYSFVDLFSNGQNISGLKNFTNPLNTYSGGTFNNPVLNNATLTGTPTFSGPISFAGTVTFSGLISASQVQSFVPTGTPPLIIASTTLVPNLNVSLLNGVLWPASPATHTVPVVTATNTVTYKVIPDCQDTTGNHLNYTQAGDTFSCGTSVPVTTTTMTLKKGTNAGNYAGASGSFAAVDGTNLAYTVNIPTGSNLIIHASGTMSPTGGTSTWYAALFDGASKLTVQMLSWTAGGASNGCPGTQNCGSGNFDLNWMIVGDGASHTIQLEYAAEAASNDTSGRILNTGGIFPTMTFTLAKSN